MALVINPDAPTKIKLNLDGEDGNFWAVLGAAISVAKQIGWSETQCSDFRKLCMSSDYGHALVQVDKEFGAWIDLEMSFRYMKTIDSKKFRAHFLNDIAEQLEDE